MRAGRCRRDGEGSGYQFVGTHGLPGSFLIVMMIVFDCDDCDVILIVTMIVFFRLLFSKCFICFSYLELHLFCLSQLWLNIVT